MRPVIVFGGYGTFGSLVSRELARRGVSLVVAGRDAARAEAIARELGAGHRGVRADATRPDECRAALDLAGPGVAVSCAGPFSGLGTVLLEACLERGCHHVDLADDRSYARLVRARGERFAARGIAAVTGCSSLPAISGALTLLLAEGQEPPERVRITLFIGNDNPKGEAAVESAVALLGRPVVAPQGALTGFGDPETVELPPPFGRRRVVTFESPDYDLLPGLVGASAVSVKVGFELCLAMLAFGVLARLGSGHGPRTARALRFLSGLWPWRGSSGGAVLAEVRWPDGTERRASLSGASDGQRMAALPCALVAHALAGRERSPSGIVEPWDLLGSRGLLEAIAREGFVLAVTSRGGGR